MHGLERVTIKDPNYESEACIEIWQHEIHIRTAWSNYTYRIFTRGNADWCEYIGAYRGLLEQKLLPSLTPKMNILDSEVVESSLTGNKRQTLRTYSSENLKLKNFRRDNFKEEYNVTSPQDHPTVVYDEYIKEVSTLYVGHPQNKSEACLFTFFSSPCRFTKSSAATRRSNTWHL